MNSLTSFDLTLIIVPFSSLLIAGVYVAQYKIRAGRRSWLVLVHALAVIGIVITYLSLAWTLRKPTPFAWVGLAIFVVGAALFLHSAIVHRASLVPAERYPIFVSGVYRKIRHPIYSGGLLGAAGLILVAPTWELLVAWAVLFVSMWVLLLIEEFELRVRYGKEYDTYLRQTKRLIPYLL